MEWRTIEVFPDFKISNTGIIKNFKTGVIITQRLHGGYYSITLGDSINNTRKIYRVHRLLAIYFIENSDPDKYKIVDHIDGCKTNNDLSNLRWCTYSENVKNWYRHRTNYNKVMQYSLKGEIIKIWDSASTAAKELGFVLGCIRDCCNGRKLKYRGFIWKYENLNRKQQCKNVIDFNDYVCIGKINGNDFSQYYMSRDGSTIINKNNKYKEITFSDNSSGYKCAKLYTKNDDRKPFNLLVHKIINQVLKNGDYNDIIDHKDGNKLNNYLNNLEVVTRKINTTRAIGKSVRQINIKTGETIKIYSSYSEACSELNVKHRQNIARACTKEQKTAYGYHWELV